MFHLPATASQRQLLTRREAFRRGTLFLGGAVLGGSLVPKMFAQAAPQPAANSVENPEHPIAQMRVQISQAPIGTDKVVDGIYMLSGPGGNVGLYVGEDALVAIDSGSGKEPSTARLREAIKSVSDRPLRYLVNTHWHFDHTDGNANLHSMGATIIAHHNVRKRLATPNTIAFFNALFPSSGKNSLPTLTFDREMKLEVGADTLHLVHFPQAHTDGDAIVHWQRQNVVQTGDLFFSGMYPFIDGSTGGSIDGVIVSLEKILQLTNSSTRIIPGHGPVSGQKELRESIEMLRTCRERIGTLKTAGKTIDDAVAAKPLGDLDEKWGKGFFNTEAFTRLVYSLV
jgi:cyclase